MKALTVVVGVCGGVAAYKVLDVVSALRKQGHNVRVLMSEAGTRIVSPTTFAAVSGAPVGTTMWPDVGQGELEDLFPHIYPASHADVFLLMPATANSIAKIAHGFGSDLLSTSVLALPPGCTRVFAPAMNVNMWHNPAVQENVRRLESAGWIRLGPGNGPLACGVTGDGRMMEPAHILQHLDTLLQPTQILQGKRLLILSGPTHEHLDPIRYLGNPSSGLMGKALAETALRLGAEVDFVSGPVPVAHLPAGVSLFRVTSALDMLDEARKHLAAADVVLFAAAVADYRPEVRADEKRAKTREPFDLRLLPNPDLAATLHSEKRPETLTIGFALQTHDGENQARRKLQEKGLDGIVLNGPDSLGSDSGTFFWLGKQDSDFEPWGPLSKSDAAARILAKIPH